MNITITENQFIDLFKECNREENFSYEARKALFNYFEQLEEETGESFSVDIIAICCDYTEFDSLEDIRDSYSCVESLEDLRDQTQVIELENGKLLIQNY